MAAPPELSAPSLSTAKLPRAVKSFDRLIDVRILVRIETTIVGDDAPSIPEAERK
jgi:hypothetical protein